MGEVLIYYPIMRDDLVKYRTLTYEMLIAKKKV